MFSIHGIHKAASTIGISVLLLHPQQKNHTQGIPPLLRNEAGNFSVA